MRTIRVETRLEPNPGVPVLSVRECARDFNFHRIASRHGDLDLGGPFSNGRVNGRTADVSGSSPGLDQSNLFGGLDHACLHRVRSNIDQLWLAQHVQRGIARGQCHVIAFNPNPLRAASEAGHSAPVVVALPIRIDDVLFNRAAPRLARVDIGGNSGAGLLRYNAAIGAAKGTIQKARIIGDVVHRC